jgi:hypothetical protein
MVIWEFCSKAKADPKKHAQTKKTLLISVEKRIGVLKIYLAKIPIKTIAKKTVQQMKVR